jgi:hypothetical protein
VSLLAPDEAVSLTEQRALAQLPELAGDWPVAFEHYYDDRMGLRDDLIRAWAWLHIEGLGVSSSDSLIVGKDDWFFFGDEAAVAQYRGLARLEREELLRWERVLEERRRWLAERGISYLLVLVPNKHRMYAQYMPDSLARRSERSQLDDLVDYLSAESSVPFLDLREALEDAARRGRVYHKTDTHWNDLGAYAAYRAIVRKLAEQVPAFEGHEPVAVRALERTTPGLGLARIVGLSEAYPERSFDLLVAEPRAEAPRKQRAAREDRARRQLPFALGTGDERLPKAVMFRDSFANALVPYLSESFSRIVYVWDRNVNPQVVEVERPDVVIQEIAERFLGIAPLGIDELRTP